MRAGPSSISSLDWKLGARLLLKYPALTIIGGLSLAVAIAIGTVGIELANELLYKRLPFDQGSRVVRLETLDAVASRPEPRVLHDFAIWQRSLKTVTELGAARVSERNVLTGEGRIESLRVAEITASAFPLTRVQPLLGRPLQPTDEVLGAEPVVVLAYDVWQRQFLQDPAIIGRVVSVGRTARTVVGVMPPRFGFPRNQQLWVPLPIQQVAPREGPAVQVFGRLADGARWQDAASELEVVSARLAADQPATHTQLRTRVRAFAGRTPGDPLRFEDLAIHAVVLLLLAAISANVATLIFARTAMREPEIVVRHALGASRARVIAQIVTEGLVLALAAAVVGLVLAQAAMRYALAQATQIVGESLPFWVDLKLEPVAVGYALLLALVATGMISLVPALKATGASVQRGLQGITSTGGTMKFGGIWSFIVGAQVACTLLFVPAAVGIYTTSVQNKPKWTAFPTERYLTFRLRMDTEAAAGEDGVPDEAQISARRAIAFEALASRLREEPGVTHVTHGDRLPTMAPEWVPVEMEQDGAPPVRLQGNYESGFATAAVGAGYHDAFDARIVSGRALHPGDAGAERAGRSQRGVHASGGQEPRRGPDPHAPAARRGWLGRARALARGRRRRLGFVDGPGRLEWGSLHLPCGFAGGTRSRRRRRARRRGGGAACAARRGPCAAGRSGAAAPRHRHTARERRAAAGGRRDGRRRCRQYSPRRADFLRGRSLRAHVGGGIAPDARDRHPYRTRRQPPARAAHRVRAGRSSAWRRHHRRQHADPAHRVER